MRSLAALVALALVARPAPAQEPAEPAPAPGAGAASGEKPEDDHGVTVSYRKRKLEIATRDGNYLLQIQWRTQLRYYHPFDADPQTPQAFERPGGSTFSVRRARLKVGGHAYRPWLGYYLEYDFPSTTLLDWRLTLAPRPSLQLRAGQWKVNFSRERVTSSGEQQLAERSIVNDPFTLDRQQGLMLMGHVLRGTPGDSWYHLGFFTGMGRGGGANDDRRLMWLGRYHWNLLGRDLELSGSDIARRAKPAASLAFAAVRNRSPFTRFASSGGGQLPGYEQGTPGQYDVRQWYAESAFKWRGFSFENENHWKTIDDRVAAATTRLEGGYVQGGYFIHGLWSGLPRPSSWPPASPGWTRTRRARATGAASTPRPPIGSSTATSTS